MAAIAPSYCYFVAVITVLALGAGYSRAMTSPACDDVTIVTRSEWGARPPRASPVTIPTPVNMTFIHHSAGESSTTSDGCQRLVRGIQDFHMDVRGWNDIGYSFLVCEDGRVYEGRGWNIEGAHTLGYNTIALGICFVGTYTAILPNSLALTAGKNLIQCGIEKGYIVSNYELFGHRDGRVGTECPGDDLYALIRTWPNYSTRHIHKYGQVTGNDVVVAVDPPPPSDASSHQVGSSLLETNVPRNDRKL